MSHIRLESSRLRPPTSPGSASPSEDPTSPITEGVSSAIAAWRDRVIADDQRFWQAAEASAPKSRAAVDPATAPHDPPNARWNPVPKPTVVAPLVPRSTLVNPESVRREGLFLLPRRHLEAYESDRESSPLGRIFSVTNGMHDEIDAVVVVGRQELLAAPQAIIRAGIDRYHNEMTRAERGSKPRVYFVNDQIDNDAVMALVHRLQSGGGTVPETQWAIILLDDSYHGVPLDDSHPDAENSTIPLVFETLLECLPGDPTRRVLPVVRRDSDLHRRCVALECDELFLIDGDLASRHRLFSVMTMLPMAMLALDCIKWLESAMLVSEEFRDAECSATRLGQFIQAFSLGPVGRFVATTWGLEQVARSLNELIRDAQTESRLDGFTRDRAEPLDGTRWDGESQSEHGDTPIELRLEAFRHDGLPWSRPETWVDQYRQITAAEDRPHRVVLPLLDTASLGQLFQTVLIAVANGFATETENLPHPEQRDDFDLP